MQSWQCQVIATSTTPLGLVIVDHLDLMASATAPTADWEAVSDTFYRKVQLYTALWDADFNLNDYFLRGAPYGGALGECIGRRNFRNANIPG